MVTPSAELKRPSEISEWEIEQARKLIKLSLQDPLPSLLAEPDILSCLYYPLRQVPLPQFQFEMLLWESDKLNAFPNSHEIKMFHPKIVDDVLANPAALYKRADDYTVLCIVYSLKSQMVAVFSNEIAQTAWEIVGVYSVRALETHIAKNRRHLHTFEAFEDAYQAERQASLNATGAADSEDDASYWDMYNKENDSSVVKTQPKAEKQSEEDYWKMYDTAGDEDEEANADQQQPPASFITNLILSLAPLYEECGLNDKKMIAAGLRSILESKGISDEALHLPEVAHNHAQRTFTLLEQQFGEGLRQAAYIAISVIENS